MKWLRGAAAATLLCVLVGVVSGCGGSRFGPESRAVTRLSVTGSGDTVAVGKQLVLTANAFAGSQATNASPSDLTWTVSDDTKATITTNANNTNATLTGMAEGPVTITVKHRNGVQSAPFSVTVTPAGSGPATVDRIAITPHDNNVVAVGGGSITLTAAAFAGQQPVAIGAGDLSWTVSDNAKATVMPVAGTDDAVSVTGIAAGDVTVTVVYQNTGLTDTVSVHIDPANAPAQPVDRIEIFPSANVEVAVGGAPVALDVRAFSGAQVVPLNASDIEWRPINGSIVRLDAIVGGNAVYAIGLAAGDTEVEAAYKSNSAITNRVVVKVTGTADGVPIIIR